MRTPRSAIAALSLLALATGLTACGGGGDDAPGSSSKEAASSGGGTVTIQSFAFSPTPLTAKVGDTITIANHDGTAHTATAKDGSFDTGHVEGGKEATITVTKGGTVEYFCDIHDYMRGVIRVEA
jgi:plastocyanin